MKQTQPTKQLNGKTPLTMKNSQPAGRNTPRQIKGNADELTMLSALIERNVQDLTQPMTVILGLSELLLLQTPPDSRLATDLDVVVKQANRVSQILKEVNELVVQKNKLLSALGNRRASPACLTSPNPSDQD